MPTSTRASNPSSASPRRTRSAFARSISNYKQIAEEYLIPSTYGRPVGSAQLAATYMESELGKRILHVTEMTPYEICKSWDFETPELSALLLYLICMWGIDPEETNSSYLVPLYFNRMLNATLVKGGSHRLSSTLQKAGILAGMEVMENHEVKRFIVENGVVKGVEIAPTGTDGPLHRIDAHVVVTYDRPDDDVRRVHSRGRSAEALQALPQHRTELGVGAELALPLPPGASQEAALQGRSQGSRRRRPPSSACSAWRLPRTWSRTSRK